MILVRLWELDGYADVVYRLAFINVSDEVEWLMLATSALFFLAFMH